MSKQFWFSLSYSVEPFCSSASFPRKFLYLHIAHLINLCSIHCKVPLIVDGLNFPKQFIHPWIKGFSISAMILILHPIFLWSSSLVLSLSLQYTILVLTECNSSLHSSNLLAFPLTSRYGIS